MMRSWDTKFAKTEYREAEPSILITDRKYCFVDVARLRGVRLLKRYNIVGKTRRKTTIFANRESIMKRPPEAGVEEPRCKTKRS